MIHDSFDRNHVEVFSLSRLTLVPFEFWTWTRKRTAESGQLVVI